MPYYNPAPTYAEPILDDELTGKPRFNPIWLKWFVDQVQVFNALGVGSTGTVSIDHESLTGLLGGGTGDHYHITSGEAAALLGGLSVTITTAKLTPLGATGSMTFTGGVLTAQTPAT